MTMWIFPGSESFLESVVENHRICLEEDYNLSKDDTIGIYIPSEKVVVGLLEVSSLLPTDGETVEDKVRTRATVEIPDSLFKAPIERGFRKEEFAQGGELGEKDGDAIREKLNRSDDTFDTSIDNSSQNAARNADSNPHETLLDISKARNLVDARGEDFSDEEHGRLQLGGNDFRDADFSYTNLSGTSFEGADLRGADFSDATLRGVDFTEAKLSKADFGNADLSNATFRGVDLTRCHFEDASMEGVDLRRTTLQEADFQDVHMPRAKMQGVRPIGADFSNSNLSGIQTDSDTDFENASFRNSNLDDTDFSGCELSTADFEKASLKRSDFVKPCIDDASFVNADLTEADFTGQEASGVDFTASNLRDATFQDAVLEDAWFVGARLKAADFEDAQMPSAVMSDVQAGSANFDGADLERVSFSQAELFGATFVDAELYGAILQSARIGGDTRFHPPEDENQYVIYDPRSGRCPHDDSTDEIGRLEKAASVYKTLETVMQQNAYGDRVKTYFINRKELARRKHHQNGNLTKLAVNRIGYHSCGFGESFALLSRWAIVYGLLMGVVYPLLNLNHTVYGSLSYSQDGISAFLYGTVFSFSLFTGLGYGQFQVNKVGETLAAIETGMGVVFFALLIFVLTRLVNR